MAEILIVDDSISIRNMVASTLEDSGYDVEQAMDGQEALECAKQQQFKVVITDINMPNIDGITLIGKLRDLPEYKFVPILCLTTETGSDIKKKGKEVGATGWMEKPFDPESLIKTIKKVLN